MISSPKTPDPAASSEALPVVPAVPAAVSPAAVLGQLLNGKAPVTIVGLIAAALLFYIWPQMTARFDANDVKMIALELKIGVLSDKITDLNAAYDNRMLRLELGSSVMDASGDRWDKHCEDSKALEALVAEIRLRQQQVLERLAKLESRP